MDSPSRKYRLALAGSELLAGNKRIIDIALKYGYDSPDSFTKEFTRFHGVTLACARKDYAILKYFAPLKVKISLEGGYLMDYRIEKKETFTVIADDYATGAGENVPKGFTVRTIPAFTWAVFPIVDPMPTAFRDASTKIFTEWLSALKEYESAAGYCIENTTTRRNTRTAYLTKTTAAK